jgi:hypothetical protein
MSTRLLRAYSSALPGRYEQFEGACVIWRIFPDFWQRRLLVGRRRREEGVYALQRVRKSRSGGQICLKGVQGLPMAAVSGQGTSKF